MITLRPSVAGDVPRMRELWKLAFEGDEGYLDNFYHNYYRPQRAVVLEEDGVVWSMASWFDTAFVVGDNSFKAGYIYAVATHPDVRSRGFCRKLMAFADEYLKQEHGCRAVTTVPSEPSLHAYYASTGFRECFVTAQDTLQAGALSQRPAPGLLRPATPEEYGRVRETLLKDTPHIAYPPDALAYQAGCCRADGGGLFVASTAEGDVALCAEGSGRELVLKELLGAPAATQLVLPDLPRVLPAERYLARGPLASTTKTCGGWKFGMLKWLEPELEAGWNWDSTAYLGLAFD